MRVLLVYPDFTDPDSRNKKQGNYSEGLASISAVLKNGGHEVSLYHVCYMPDEHEFIAKIKNYQPEIVGFSVRTAAFSLVKEFVSWTKKAADAYVICGGYHATLAPEETISAPGVDAVCVGEGEFPMLELCDRLQGGERPLDIPSLWFREGAKVIRNDVRPLIEDLDALPMPDFELFDFPNLLSSKMQTALVMVSRGCVFSCTYCSNSKLREVYPNRARYARFKSPGAAISYLKGILGKYPQIRYINFRDAILNMDPDWFVQFIALYRDKIALPFTCNLRLDLLDSGVVSMLKASGCYMVDVGIESGDEELRAKYLCRHMSDKQIKQAFTWFAQHNIATLTYNIVGLPYENLQKALKTIKLNAALKPNRMIANIFTPYPLTRLTDIAREAGFIGDEVDFSKKVVLRQPQFTESEILFAHYYFGLFVTLYKLIFRLPRPLSQVGEAVLDRIFTSKLLPRRLLIWVYGNWISLFNGIKHFLIQAAPGFYLKLRNFSVRQNQASAKI